MATEKRLIDANALVPYLWALFRYFGSLPCSEADKATQRAIKRCIGEVKKMPTVDAVEVVHGRWIEKQEAIPWCEDDVEVYTVCSVCESYSPGESNYCPNCGAKMDGGADHA